MNTYHLELSACELYSLKVAANMTINKLERLCDDIESVLDEELEPKQYSLHLSSLATVAKDRANMRSILSQIESLS